MKTIDVNTADLVELEAIPFIGKKRAEAILAWREAHGPFESLAQLREMPGFGEKMAGSLEDFLSVGKVASRKRE